MGFSARASRPPRPCKRRQPTLRRGRRSTTKSVAQHQQRRVRTLRCPLSEPCGTLGGSGPGARRTRRRRQRRTLPPLLLGRRRQAAVTLLMSTGSGGRGRITVRALPPPLAQPRSASGAAGLCWLWRWSVPQTISCCSSGHGADSRWRQTGGRRPRRVLLQQHSFPPAAASASPLRTRLASPFEQCCSRHGATMTGGDGAGIETAAAPPATIRITPAHCSGRRGRCRRARGRARRPAPTHRWRKRSRRRWGAAPPQRCHRPHCRRGCHPLLCPPLPPLPPSRPTATMRRHPPVDGNSRTAAAFQYSQRCCSGGDHE